MRVINHNWSATKQRPHPQSVAEIIRQFCQRTGSVSVSRHFLLQAPQCPCSVRKRFSRDHCCRGRSKPGCQIVGSHTRRKLTTWADFQLGLCLHRLVFADLHPPVDTLASDLAAAVRIYRISCHSYSYLMTQTTTASLVISRRTASVYFSHIYLQSDLVVDRQKNCSYVTVYFGRKVAQLQV